jgi:hypothetical protein
MFSPPQLWPFIHVDPRVAFDASDRLPFGLEVVESGCFQPGAQTSRGFFSW